MANRPNLKRAVAKTKNTAKDYNDNFDKMMDFVDETLLECKSYVDAYMPSQTGQGGKYLTTNGTSASWVDLGGNFPYSKYIDGLIITKTGSSTIKVSKGSCYDSTFTKILTLSSDTTKTNSNQAANATYYVFLISNAAATSFDILIDDSSNPSLPTNYVLYRMIGYYKTDSDSEIDTISNYSANGGSTGSNLGFPDFTAGIEISLNTDTTASQDGWIEVNGYTAAGGAGEQDLIINGTTRVANKGVGGTDGTNYACIFCPIKKNDVYKLTKTGSGTASLKFYPMRSN